jgi:hypothetical protein
MKNENVKVVMDDGSISTHRSRETAMRDPSVARIQIKTLKHNELVTINGRYGKVGTVRGYAEQYDKNPDDAEAREKDLMKTNSMASMVWSNQEATVICGDKGFYEAEKARKLTATQLVDGEWVIIEGKKYTVKYMGDYSDFIHFVE